MANVENRRSLSCPRHRDKKRYAKIPVVAWHNKATEVAENFQRNDKVRVQGSIRTRLNERNGHKYSAFEIVLDNIILLSREEQPPVAP